MVATYKDIRRLTGLSLANVARGLRSRRSMTIGVVLDELDSTFNTTIVSRIEERLREAWYGTIICDSRKTPRHRPRSCGSSSGRWSTASSSYRSMTTPRS